MNMQIMLITGECSAERMVKYVYQDRIISSVHSCYCRDDNCRSQGK